jgi:hypothetical protein
MKFRTGQLTKLCGHISVLVNIGVTIQKYIETKIYRTITYMLFCTGVKLGLVTFREEHMLRVFENWVLRKIFGPKRDEVMGMETTT